MITPEAFAFNSETSATNSFAKNIERNVEAQALKEFSSLVEKIRQHDIDVTVPEKSGLGLPDAVFPNNWFSTHTNGSLVLYPMMAKSRRREREQNILQFLLSERKLIDLTIFEKQNVFLEGTGSMVLDRVNHVAYAGLSSRTHPEPLAAFCEALDFESFVFPMNDPQGREIYHTNVMMSVGSRLAIICLEAVAKEYREQLIKKVESGGREILEITFEQLFSFCGNLLEVTSRKQDRFWIMSEQARLNFTPNQLDLLNRHGGIISSRIDTIEMVGGGGARCMMAEIF